MTPLDDRYSDLLGEDADGDLARLVADLDRVHTSTTPPARLRAAVQRLAAQQTCAPQHEPLAPRRRGLSWRRGRVAALALVAAIALAGSAVADPSLVDQALSMLPGSAQIVTQHLGAQVDLAQSVCGYTMTVNRVYADANRIVVGYTLAGPAGRSINNIIASPTLTDAQGHTLPPLEGAGTALSGNQGGDEAAWNAASLAGNAGPLALHLSVPALSAVEVISGSSPAAVSCESYAPLRSADATTIRSVTVNGPLTFNLSVPVDARVRSAELNQTAQSSHGVAVALEHIVVTPTEARLYLRGPADSLVAGGPAIVPILYVNGQEIDGSSSTAPVNGEEGDSFNASLYDQHGDWSVKVLTDPVMIDGSRHYTDAITFHITVP